MPPKLLSFVFMLLLLLLLLLLFIQVSFSLLWIPGVSVAVLEKVIGVPREIALLSVDPLRVFAFNCFTGAEKGGEGGEVSE